MTPILYVSGDATRPIGDGPKLITHVVNDRGGWGAGFVLALSKRDPAPEMFYRKWFADQRDPLNPYPGGAFMLGHIQIAPFVDADIRVVNMLAQKGFEFIETPYGTMSPLRYTALASCLYRVKAAAIARLASVHMPRIGCGLAGGKWEHVEKWVEHTLCRFDIPVTVYDLP